MGQDAGAGEDPEFDAAFASQAAIELLPDGGAVVAETDGLGRAVFGEEEVVQAATGEGEARDSQEFADAGIGEGDETFRADHPDPFGGGLHQTAMPGFTGGRLIDGAAETLAAGTEEEAFQSEQNAAEPQAGFGNGRMVAEDDPAPKGGEASGENGGSGSGKTGRENDGEKTEQERRGMGKLPAQRPGEEHAGNGHAVPKPRRADFEKKPGAPDEFIQVVQVRNPAKRQKAIIACFGRTGVSVGCGRLFLHKREQ